MMSGEEGEVRSRSSRSHGDSVSSPSLDEESLESADETRGFPLSKPSYREGSSEDHDDYLNIQPRPVTVEYKRSSKKPKKDSSKRHSHSRRDRDRHESKSKSSRREKESRSRGRGRSRERDREERRSKPSTSRHGNEHRSSSGRSRHGRSEKDRDRDRKRQDSRSRGKGRGRDRGDRHGNDRRRRLDEAARPGSDDALASKRRRMEIEQAERSKLASKGRRDERRRDEESPVSRKSSKEELPPPILPPEEDMSSVSEAETEEEIPLEKELPRSKSETEASSASEEEAPADEEKKKEEEEEEEEKSGSEEEDDSLEKAPAWKRELMEQEKADAERRAAEEEEEDSDRTAEGSDVESVHDDDQEREQADEDDEPIPERAQSPPTPPQLRLPPYYPALQGCRLVEEFQCLNRIEEGTFGVVYRAKDKRTGETVALKRLKMEREKEGFPITSLREINTLLKAQHENIVTVREIVVGSNMDKIYIVMDYVEHDLKSLMETMKSKRQVFVFSEVKTLMIQLLRAIGHLHDNWILHRDIKTSNLLLNHRGILKVGDFGLAREYGSPLKQYTAVVVTLWYRSPELLLGAKEYSTPIDIWSVGCVFGELLLMEPLFQGKSEIDQLNKIFQDLGTPSEKIWPGYKDLPGVKKCAFVDHPYNQLKKRFAGCNLTHLGMELMNMFFRYDPKKRITADQALRNPWFAEEPFPKDPAMFPTWPAKSEMPHKKTGNSPKPPSGGGQYKDLNLGDDDDKILAKWGAPLPGSMPPPAVPGSMPPPAGPGFTLKF